MISSGATYLTTGNGEAVSEVPIANALPTINKLVAMKMGANFRTLNKEKGAASPNENVLDISNLPRNFFVKM